MSFLKKIMVLCEKPGSGGSAPMPYTKISEEDIFRQGYPVFMAEIHVKSKGKHRSIEDAPELAGRPQDFNERSSRPEGLMEGPKIDDTGFPFSGKPVLRLPHKRDESMSYLKKVNAKAARIFFPEFLRIIKLLYPGMVMTFSTPPTYVWNPKNKDEPLNIQKIKDSIKTKFPELTWETRTADGAQLSIFNFPDNSHAELVIGEKANHLTVIYNIGDTKEVE